MTDTVSIVHGPANRPALHLSAAMRACLATLLQLIILAQGAYATEPDFIRILSVIDEMGTFETSDFSSTYTMVTEKPGEEQKIFQAQLFRRDKDGKFLFLILKPDLQKGQGYLKVDDNVWFYDPESRKFSHSSMKENIQDSKAKNSDLSRSSLAKDYSVENWTEGTLGRFAVYILDLTAKNDEVPYPRLKLWITKDTNLVLKSEDYGFSSRLMRTSLYPSYTKIGDRHIPSKMLFIDELRKGEQTQITLKDPSVGALPDYVFTKSYLERVNR